MRKNYFLAILFLLGLKMLPQAFTNATIFNYSIGDSLMEQYDKLPLSSSNPPKYVLRVITGKTVTPNSYTYQEYRVINEYVSTGSGYSITITNTIVTYVINNLQAVQTGTPWPNDSCQYGFDTSFVDNCGRNVFVKELKMLPPPNQCFEPPGHRITFIEGAGIYEYTVALNSFPTSGMGSESKLVYLHKVGSPACGSRPNISTSIKSNVPDIFVKVFPNPASSLIYLEQSAEGWYQLFDNSGKLVLSDHIIKGENKIDLTQLNEGVYFLRGAAGEQFYSQKIVKQ